MKQREPIQRVALFTNIVSRGAFAAVFAGLSWALKANGVNHVDVLYFSGDIDPKRNSFADNTAFVKLRGGRGLKVVAELCRYLDSARPDFLISAPLYINLIAIVGSAFSGWRWRGGKVIITHNHPIELSHRNNKKDNKWLAKALYRFASGSCAISPDLIADASRETGLDPGKIPCIPCVLAPVEIPDAEPSHPWLDQKKHFCFLSASRLIPLKRIDLLIRAFSEVVKKRDARLLLVGDGPEREQLQALVDALELNDRVVLCGYVKSARLYMARADAFVLASSEEGFGQVLSEAMSVGCPVISTRAKGGGPEYVLDGGKYGILVPCSDQAALETAMLRMMDDGVRNEYAEKARLRAQAFTPAQVGEQLLRFLDGCR